MKQKQNQHIVLILMCVLLSLSFSVYSVEGEINIRIIQGSVFIIGENAGPIEEGTELKIIVSDDQEKITNIQTYDEQSDLNFGVGFFSIDAGETITFSIHYQGNYQEPYLVKLNDTIIENKIITITSADIYHVNLYILSENSTLTAPTTPEPDHLEQNVSIHPTLQWQCNCTTINQPRYDLYLSQDIPFTPADIIVENISTQQYTPTYLSYDTSYYWQVIAKDNNTDHKESDIWQFTTKKNAVPNTPNQPIPSHQSTNRPKNQQLTWNCEDEDGEPLTYDVYFGKNSNPTKQTSNQTKQSYDPQNLSYNTTYYWKIIAWDEADQHSMSPIWSFTISETNLKPHNLTNPTPSKNETGVDIDLTLQWKGGDQDSNQVSYDLYFDTTTPPRLEKKDLTNTTYKLSNLSYNTIYYWKIISYDTDNASKEGPIWSFTTKTKNTSGLPTADAGGPYTASIGETLTFDASASTDDSKITDYKWDFNNDGSWDTIWLQTSQTTYTYNNLYNGKIRVIVKDDDNNTDTASTTVTISTNNNPPSKPSIEGPISAQANTTTTLNITATDEDGDQITYQIDWDDGSSMTTLTGGSGLTQQATHMYTSPGWYTITVTARDTSNAASSDDLFIIVNEQTKNTSDHETGGFPWIYVIIIIIVIAIAGILFYLYQNDQLPIKKESTKTEKNPNSMSAFFSNIFQRTKKSSNDDPPSQINKSYTTPLPGKESTKTTTLSKIPNPFGKNKTSSSQSTNKKSSDSSSEFKRL